MGDITTHKILEKILTVMLETNKKLDVLIECEQAKCR